MFPGEFIDLHNQNNYSAEQFRTELVKLRNMIREMGLNASDEIGVSEYEQRQVVLNWLIEEVEIRD